MLVVAESPTVLQAVAHGILTLTALALLRRMIRYFYNNSRVYVLHDFCRGSMSTVFKKNLQVSLKFTCCAKPTICWLKLPSAGRWLARSACRPTAPGSRRQTSVGFPDQKGGSNKQIQLYIGFKQIRDRYRYRKWYRFTCTSCNLHHRSVGVQNSRFYCVDGFGGLG